MVVTVKQFWATSGAPLTDYFTIIPIRGTSTVTGFRNWRDSTLRGVPKAGFNVGPIAAAVLGGPQYHMDVDSWAWAQEWIMEPGTRLEFRQNAQNTTFDLNVIWEEVNVTATYI